MREPANDIPEAKQVSTNSVKRPDAQSHHEISATTFWTETSWALSFLQTGPVSVGESVAEFDAVLATHCDFFDQALRDRFVARDSIG